MESAAAYDTRATEAERDHEVVTRFTRELKSSDEADRIYLAQIAGKPDNRTDNFINDVAVRPILAIRGQLPSSARTLRNNFPLSCYVDGNGEAASGKVGEYVFVFEGVRTYGEGGVDSMMAKDAHSELLTNALGDYIVKNGGGPYRVDEQGNTMERQADGSFKLPEISDPFPK